MVDKEQDKAVPQEGDYIGHEEQAEEGDLSPWVLGEPEQNEIDLLCAVLAIYAPFKTLAGWKKMGHRKRWFRNGKLHTNNSVKSPTLMCYTDYYPFTPALPCPLLETLLNIVHHSAFIGSFSYLIIQ